MKTTEEMLDEIENANNGDGPDPVATGDEPRPRAGRRAYQSLWHRGQHSLRRETSSTTLSSRIWHWPT